MKSGSTAAKEKRWLIVTEDGRHATVGRHSDPTDSEVSSAGDQLDRMGVAGWLVVSEGRYYGRSRVSLLMVRAITNKQGEWSDAERRWHQQRELATAAV